MSLNDMVWRSTCPSEMICVLVPQSMLPIEITNTMHMIRTPVKLLDIEPQCHERGLALLRTDV